MLTPGTLRNLIVAGLLAAAALAGPSAGAHESGIKISGAWVRMSPPTLKTHGGYLTIANHEPEPKELIGASSPDYGEVQIHHSQIVDGVATMQRMESIEIAAGKTVVFKPGGLHLMLVSAKKPLENGGVVPITLSFRSGETISVEATVMTSAPDGSDMQGMGDCANADHHTH